MLFSQLIPITSLAEKLVWRKISQGLASYRKKIVGPDKVRDWRAVLPLRINCGGFFFFSRDTCSHFLDLLGETIVDAVLL